MTKTREQLLMELTGVCDNILSEGLNVNKDQNNPLVKRYHEIYEELEK